MAIEMGKKEEQQMDEASFSRVLNQLEALSDSKGIHVKFWTTDNDGAFINVLNAAARILLCIWHMNKDVPQEQLYVRVTPSAVTVSTTTAFLTCYAHVAVIASATAAASP
ncbi:hypothetical protein E4U14_004428 [Claviceps sp. LM454 group G7]|nr:hypothetical protein E4U14_004428 [Claviceps sp. LM454 group G7]